MGMYVSYVYNRFYVSMHLRIYVFMCLCVYVLYVCRCNFHIELKDIQGCERNVCVYVLYVCRDNFHIDLKDIQGCECNETGN